MTRRSRLRSDGGLTMLEMLISMMVLGIIMGPLVGTFVTGMLQTQTVAQKSVNSSDGQLISTYFDSDVASSEQVTTTNDCGPTIGLFAGLQFAWTDPGTSAVTHVAYLVTENTDAETELRQPAVYKLSRYVCVNGGSATSTRLARSLSAVPRFECDGASPCASTTPNVVRITASEFGRATDAGPSEFQFVVSATRRVSS